MNYTWLNVLTFFGSEIQTEFTSVVYYDFHTVVLSVLSLAEVW